VARRDIFAACASTALLVAAAAAPGEARAGFRAQLDRAGLVELPARAPGVSLELRYASDGNFTGRRLPGYCRPLAFLRRRAARSLADVQRGLEARGLGLLVLDAYRPARASRAMVRWAVRVGRPELLDGWIARRSNHNRGTAVDLTLVRRESGRPLDMGTPYDSFSPRSATTAAGGRALRNRLKLRRAMEAAGFANYRREWWHYDYPGDRRALRLDVPLGC
jgi:D-alanyl-D-alanine dipeptidase